MTDDVDARLERLEQDRDAQRRAWLVKSAESRGWHAPGDAPVVVETDGIATAAEAARRVERFDTEHSYMRQEMISEDEAAAPMGRRAAPRHRRLRRTRRTDVTNPDRGCGREAGGRGCAGGQAAAGWGSSRLGRADHSAPCGQLTVSVPFMPAASWPGTEQ